MVNLLKIRFIHSKYKEEYHLYWIQIQFFFTCSQVLYFQRRIIFQNQFCKIPKNCKEVKYYLIQSLLHSSPDKNCTLHLYFVSLKKIFPISQDLRKKSIFIVPIGHLRIYNKLEFY